MHTWKSKLQNVNQLLFVLLGSLPDLTFPHYFSMAKNGSEKRVILNETEMIQNNHVKPNQKIRHYSKLVFRISITTSIYHLNEKIAPSKDTPGIWKIKIEITRINQSHQSTCDLDKGHQTWQSANLIFSVSSVSLGSSMQGTSLALFNWSRICLAFNVTSLLLLRSLWAPAGTQLTVTYIYKTVQ